MDKHAIAKRLRTVKKAVAANEERDREREKLRVKEVKLQKKLKERAMNAQEETHAVLLGTEEDGEEMMEEEEEEEDEE